MDYAPICRKFEELFGKEYSLYASPGRVNLIGEYTDFNGGFVFPGAIDKTIVTAIRPNGTRTVNAWAVDMNEASRFALDEKPAQGWALYIYGVVAELLKRGLPVEGFDCVFGGDIPIGSGLSTSAALESTFVCALNGLFKLGLSKLDFAKIGQAAEHNAVGVRCGIMDQFASVFGETGKLIRLDCRSLEYVLYPFNPVGCRVVLLDTCVKHNLAASAYNIRRSECEAGVAAVSKVYPQVSLLRDVTPDMMNEFKTSLPENVFRRCMYVAQEDQRVIEACQALEKADYTRFGELMYGSHEGLSHEFCVSCDESDFLVEVARRNGVLGARMMGGGFGGCTINLVEEGRYEAFIADAKAAYAKAFGKAPKVYDVCIGQGSRQIG